MQTTLILFSGLAGTGKSTLAHGVAHELQIPVISFDYFIDYALPRHMMTNPGNWTNQDVFEMMNKLAEQQLSLGVSVILDAVYFSKESRDVVHAVAEKCNAHYRVIHTVCSDEDVWRERVIKRVDNASAEETPAQWETILAELGAYDPWDESEAVFVDAIHPVAVNLQKVKNYLSEPQDSAR